MGMERTSRFDDPKNDRGWHTAFYYLVEHLKHLSKRKLTHKRVYALVGSDGRYINHEKAQIRKSYAGKLSHTIHSGEYARQMVQRHLEDASIFDEAAEEICSTIFDVRDWSDEKLCEYLANECWPDIWLGLSNEKHEWRADFDMERVGLEAKYVFGQSANTSEKPQILNLDSRGMMSAILMFVSIGQLIIPDGVEIYRDTLGSEQTKTINPDKRDNTPPEATLTKGCLLRYSDPDCQKFRRAYDLPTDRPLAIGRHPDNDARESSEFVGRHHGRVFSLHGEWFYDDLASVNGSMVLRGNQTIRGGSIGDITRFRLEFGDIIAIANVSFYLFAARDDETIPSY